jgi:hypothetical protein
VVWRYLPETARRDLDELNPVDALSPPASTQ